MTGEVNPVKKALEDRIRSGVPQHVDWEGYVPQEDDTPELTEAAWRLANEAMDDADDCPDVEEPLGRDDRVSLWPLSFEDVVRAMWNTPRKPRKKKP